MSDFLFILGLLGFVVFIVLLIMAAIRKKQLKPYIIGFCVCLGVAVVGLAMDDEKKGENQPDTTGTSASATSSPIVANTQEPTKKDMTISVVSTKIGKDYKDAPILLVEYEFTNNTDKAQSFTFLCTDKAFQGGIECNSIVVSDEVDAQQQLNDIQPGVAYKLTVGYNLHDTTQDVSIEITELIGDDVFLKQTIKLTE